MLPFGADIAVEVPSFMLTSVLPVTVISEPASEGTPLYIRVMNEIVLDDHIVGRPGAEEDALHVGVSLREQHVAADDDVRGRPALDLDEVLVAAALVFAGAEIVLDPHPIDRAELHRVLADIVEVVPDHLDVVRAEDDQPAKDVVDLVVLDPEDVGPWRT